MVNYPKMNWGELKIIQGCYNNLPNSRFWEEKPPQNAECRNYHDNFILDKL